MLSLKDVVAVKLAVEICNNPLLKKEILCVPGSDFDVNKSRCPGTQKMQWNLFLETKAEILLETLDITEQLQEKILGVVLSIGKRILSWAKYHERILGFSRNDSFSFINRSFFSTRTIVDCKKAAEELMKSKSLTVKQKYKLALLYCMNNHIPDLYNEMTEKDKEEFYDSEHPSRINQPPFVKFWSYYLKDEVDKLRADLEPNLYWLKMAVKSGSRDVVEYCLEKTHLIRDDSALVYAALELVRNKITAEEWTIFDTYWRNTDPIPSHYYIDVLCFLFSKMRQDTQIRFLKEDIEGDPIRHSRVLEFFLEWPHQGYFLKTAKLMWDFLPETSYFKLIQRFTFKIGASKHWYEYGEEKHYDYRELLRNFLNQIPEPNKRCVTRNIEDGSTLGHKEILNAGTILISKLLTLESYTNQDKEIIEWILNNATNDEKEKIITSEKGIYTCSELMRLRRWKLLDEFVSSCYASRENVCKFKRELIFTVNVHHVCVQFITKDDWHAFETLMKWSILSDGEINQLKENVILSKYVRKLCLDVISSNENFTLINKVIRRCFRTEEKATAFRKELLSSPKVMEKFVELIISDKVELANEFIKCSFSSEEEIVHYKKDVANAIGINICERLIFNFDCIPISSSLSSLPMFPSNAQFYSIHGRETGPTTLHFNDGKWEEVKKFLTWCFSSEDEIRDFKKSLTMIDAGITRKKLERMLFLLINTNKWKDAEILFAWLGLSIEEILELKRETIVSRVCMRWIDISIQKADIGNLLDSSGGNWEEMENFLRWFLEDKTDVLRFRNRFDKMFGFRSYEDQGEIIPYKTWNNLNTFYLIIKKIYC